MSSVDGLRLPSLGLLRRYLTTSGWQRTLLPRGDLLLFTLPVGKVAVEIVLPSGNTEDGEERIVPALHTLASLSNRTAKEVAAEVAMLDFDIMRARLPDSIVLRESVPLRVAEKFTGNTRRLLASASAAEQRRTLLVQDAQKIGADYANRCRFGHTFQGSFGFTIESPAGPAPELVEGKVVSPPPFERRVVERIATGIQTVALSQASGSPEALEQGAINGLNINMLEDFTSLVADSSASSVSFSFVFTPAWPASRQFTASTEISQDALVMIDRVISSLRPNTEPVTETIVGQVIMLQTREIPTDLLHEGTREIAIEGMSVQRGPLMVRVRLSPQDYLVAFNAHGAGRAVSVAGLVNRSSRGNTLTGVSDFKEA